MQSKIRQELAKIERGLIRVKGDEFHGDDWDLSPEYTLLTLRAQLKCELALADVVRTVTQEFRALGALAEKIAHRNSQNLCETM